MTTTSRRAMLAGITAVPAIVTGTSLGAATAADGDPEAQRLWIRYSRLSKASSENMRAMSAAMERLPRWAGTGPGRSG